MGNFERVTSGILGAMMLVYGVVGLNVAHIQFIRGHLDWHVLAVGIFLTLMGGLMLVLVMRWELP